MTSASRGKTTCAVIGAFSMVGSRFCDLAGDNLNLIKADLHSGIPVDITDKKSVDDFFKNYDFAWVLLFSAFTDVDAAERQRNDKRGLCWQINVDGVQNIVERSKEYQKSLLFISTDFVFDGTSGPYAEDAPVGPDFGKVSWYGISKIEAEKIIRENLSKYIILRIAYPFRGPFEEKDDIVKRVLRLYGSDKLYPMFYDQIITPTFIDDLGSAIPLLLDRAIYGIIHLASPAITNQFDFAKKVLEIFQKDVTKLKKTSIVDFLKNPSSTPRPIKGGLKVEKITKLGFSPTDWEKAIEAVFLQSGGKLI